MSRARKPPRLWLRPARPGHPAIWIILDRSRQTRTGAGANELERAQIALEQYLARSHAPPSGSNEPHLLLVDEVLTAYLEEHAPTSPSKKWILHTAAPVLEWWSGKSLAEVNGPNCRKYVTWRTAQRVKNTKPERARFVSEQTARHELKTLRTAINFYHAEHGPLVSVPKVTLPRRSSQREDYWLSRSEVAARIREARRHPYTRHLARMLLIGVYTGTRPGATLRLGWLPSPTGGWFDLEHGVLHRKPFNAVRSRKKAPPAKIHKRLALHLQRWRKRDLEAGIVAVIHYRGGPIDKLRRSWAGVAKRAGAERKDGPHIMRHTAATWQMHAGTDLVQAASYLGMTPETLWNEYGHHHPDFQAGAASADLGRKRSAERKQSKVLPLKSAS